MHMALTTSRLSHMSFGGKLCGHFFSHGQARVVSTSAECL